MWPSCTWPPPGFSYYYVHCVFYHTVTSVLVWSLGPSESWHASSGKRSEVMHTGSSHLGAKSVARTCHGLPLEFQSVREMCLQLCRLDTSVTAELDTDYGVIEGVALPCVVFPCNAHLQKLQVPSSTADINMGLYMIQYRMPLRHQLGSPLAVNLHISGYPHMALRSRQGPTCSPWEAHKRPPMICTQGVAYLQS